MKFLTENEVDFQEALMYRTVASDLSDLSDITYDVLVFFSPLGIESLYENFPDFKQNETRIAAFGNSTKKAVEDRGLVLNIAAPAPKTNFRRDVRAASPDTASGETRIRRNRSLFITFPPFPAAISQRNRFRIASARLQPTTEKSRRPSRITRRRAVMPLRRVATV